jgi:GNAT superfamily N-acetyltransferase
LGTLTVEIRPLVEEELGIVEGLLNFDWGNSQKHAKRLEMQQCDELIYLIAWVEGQAVGHAVLEWAGKVHVALAHKIRNCPNIDDLFVHPEHWSKGVGSQLLERAQDMAVSRGYRCVGLGVAVDNHRARTLYNRLGYIEVGVGEYVDRWQYTDKDGQQVWHQEFCHYLVKSL